MKLFTSLREMARGMDRAASGEVQQPAGADKGSAYNRRPPASPKPTKVRHTSAITTPASSRARLGSPQQTPAPQVSEAHFTAPNGQPRKGLKAVGGATEGVAADGGKAPEWPMDLEDAEALNTSWSIGSFARLVSAGR